MYLKLDYLKEVQVVPVKYSFGRQQHIDKVTQTVREFYEQMASDHNHPKTSQPTARDFIKMYDFVSSHYNNIISIHLSQKLDSQLSNKNRRFFIGYTDPFLIIVHNFKFI